MIELESRAWGRFIGTAALAAGIALTASPASAEEGLTGPSLDPEGKPLSPPAPTNGVEPKLFGISFLGGAAVIDFGPLNDRLSDAGYPEDVPALFPMLGGQGFGLFSRFLIGGSGAGLLTRSADAPGGGETSATGGWGTVDFGYQAIRVDGFILAPIVSLGGYGMEVNIHSTAETDFDDVIQAPARGTSLTNNGFVGGVSVLTQLIVLGRNARIAGARSGFALGLRIGGLYGFPYREWRADGAKADGGPNFGLRGGYAALSLGAGTW